MQPEHDPAVIAVNRLPAAALILDVVTKLTGMRFAAVARVTDTRWLTCASLDAIAFDLGSGDELPLETTICDEIREHHRTVVIPHVSADAHYASHRTPKLYGFQSYI